MKEMRYIKVKRKILQSVKRACENEKKISLNLARDFLEDQEKHFFFFLMAEHLKVCERLLEFVNLYLEAEEGEEITIDSFSLVSLKNKSNILNKHKDYLCKYNISTDLH